MPKKIHIIACIQVVFVWFTTLFGGGWATGAQALSWFAGHGWTALWMPMVGMLIVSFIGWITIEWARKEKLIHYRMFMENVYGNKWIPTIHEIGLVLGTLIGLASVLAAAGGMFVSWNLNYWVGVVLIGVICILGCLFGADVVRRISSFMGIVIVVLIAIIFMVVAMTRNNLVADIVVNHTMYTSYGKAWYSGAYFGLTSCTLLMSLLPVMDELKTRKDTVFTVIIGFIINCTIMIMLSYTMLAFMPEIMQANVPLLYAVTEINNSFLRISYSIILLFAIITTGIGMLYTYAIRFSPFLKSVKNEKVRYLIVLTMFLVVSALLAKLGLMTLVGKGYTVTAYINMALVVVGMPIILLIKIMHRKKSGGVLS